MLHSLLLFPIQKCLFLSRHVFRNNFVELYLISRKSINCQIYFEISELTIWKWQRFQEYNMKIRRTYLSIIPRIFLSSHNHIRTFSVYSVRNIKEKCAKFHSKNPLISNCFMYGGITGFTELTQQTVQLKLIPYWTEKELSSYDYASLAR